jgi:hypothetical protein
LTRHGEKNRGTEFKPREKFKKLTKIGERLAGEGFAKGPKQEKLYEKVRKSLKNIENLT